MSKLLLFAFARRSGNKKGPQGPVATRHPRPALRPAARRRGSYDNKIALHDRYPHEHCWRKIDTAMQKSSTRNVGTSRTYVDVDVNVRSTSCSGASQVHSGSW